MVKLRLKRMGRKKQPFYRIVAMDIDSQRDGAALAEVGHYDPIHSRVDVDAEAAIAWLNQGAQMTETVRNLFKVNGVLSRWKGLEGAVKEGALTRDKPKRRKKLAAAEKAAATPAPEEDAAPAATTDGAAEAAAEAEPATAEETPTPAAAEEPAEAREAAGTEKDGEAGA